MLELLLEMESYPCVSLDLRILAALLSLIKSALESRYQEASPFSSLWFIGFWRESL